MTRHVTFILKGSLSDLPPCVSHLLGLRAAGYEVTLLHGPSSPEAVKQVESHGVEAVALPVRASSGGLGRLGGWLTFRVEVQRYLAEHAEADTRLWIGSGDTALALADLLLRRRGYVLALLELYDTVPHYRAALAPLAKRAGAVVVAERTRAQIMSNWWSLDSLPVVIPNKPFSTPRDPRLPATTAQAAEAIDMLGQETVLLYQGLISPERDLRAVARAASGIPGLLFAVMSKSYEGRLDELRRVNPDLLHLPHVPAPSHLEVTSHASLGIATYRGHSLNTLFCAPNKIYEYAAFGIPMLANDVPGLQLSVGRYDAGLCVNTDDPAVVREALLELLDQRQHYSLGASAMFDDTDVAALAGHAVGVAAVPRLAHNSKR